MKPAWKGGGKSFEASAAYVWTGMDDDAHAVFRLSIESSRVPAMSTNTDRRYLSVAEVARCLGIHPQTVRRWIKSGVVSSMQPGGSRSRILIPVAAIDGLQASSPVLVDPASTPVTDATGPNHVSSRRRRRPDWEGR